MRRPIIFLLFVLFVYARSVVASGNAPALAQEGMKVGAPAFGAARALRGFNAGALLADALVDAKDVGTSWIIAVLILQGVTGVIAVIAFFRPQPALHKQFADREETRDVLHEISEKLDRAFRENAKARSRMYSRLNALENALSFITGKMERSGDPDAKRIEALLSARQTEDAGDE